jgi:soluble P-type ATPase
VGRLVASGEHGLSAFIEIHIAGWGNMEIENIALDLNGTIATDGKIPSEVKEKINSLSENGKSLCINR